MRGNVDMNDASKAYLQSKDTPDFFQDATDPVPEEIHEYLQREIGCATETLSVDINPALMIAAERVLARFGWTLEEACVLFIWWCVERPNKLAEWTRHSVVRELWAEFGDVPMDPETECIDEEWHGFPAGTHREEIWRWFEETFNICVANLMYKPVWGMCCDCKKNETGFTGDFRENPDCPYQDEEEGTCWEAND